MQSIPVSFLEHLVKEMEGCKPETVVLITEGQPWQHWIIEVEGGRHFKRGWQEFCVHHDLQVGEFLVFRHHSNLQFYVSIYDPVSGCERQGSKSRKGFEVKRKPVREADAHGGVTVPTYNVTLTRSSLGRRMVYPPTAFMRSSGLYKRRCNIIVVDGKRRTWNTKLSYNNNNNSAYIFGSGWRELQAANDFKPRDIISFQLLEAGETPVVRCSRIG